MEGRGVSHLLCGLRTINDNVLSELLSLLSTSPFLSLLTQESMTKFLLRWAMGSLVHESFQLRRSNVDCPSRRGAWSW